jgi:very-short-patch-repair endonuclease
MNINSSPSNRSLLALRRGVLIAKATKAELYVKDLLDSIGEDYCFQKGFCTSNKHFIVDFYFKRRKKLCLEVDGGYHDDSEQMAYDSRRDYFLSAIRGFRVKRITNDVALALDKQSLLALISQ